jgi:hypothetical protein
VFLSHNTKDFSIVKAISDQLEAKGVTTWIDTERIVGGERFEEKIVAAMNQAKANIIFCGTHGLGRWQKVEVPYASKLDTEKGICAIVVLLPGADESIVSKEIGFLATKSYITFKSENDHEALDRLLRSLNPTRPNADLTSDIASERGVNYTRLKGLLMASQWKEADQETLDRMCEVMGRQAEGWLQIEDIQNFPCTDLRTINQLWVTHSNGRFGFGVQTQIWQKCGSPTEYNSQWEKFGEAVGWRRKGFLGVSWLAAGGGWKKYSEMLFDASAPEGHLPGGVFPGWEIREDGGWFTVKYEEFVRRMEGRERLMWIDYGRDGDTVWLRWCVGKWLSSLAQRFVDCNLQ